MTTTEVDPRPLLLRVRDELVAEIKHLPVLAQIDMLEARPGLRELLDTLQGDVDPLLVVRQPQGLDQHDLTCLAEALGEDVAIVRTPRVNPRDDVPTWRTPWGRVEALRPDASTGHPGGVFVLQHAQTAALTPGAARELAARLLAAAQLVERAAAEAVTG